MKTPIPKTKVLEAAFRRAGHNEDDIPTLVHHHKVTTRTLRDRDTGAVTITVPLPNGGWATPRQSK